MGSSRIIIYFIYVTSDPMIEKNVWNDSCFAIFHEMSSGLRGVSGPFKEFNIFFKKISGLVSQDDLYIVDSYPRKLSHVQPEKPGRVRVHVDTGETNSP